MPQTPRHILSSVFGFDSFRGQQEQVVDHVIAGGDGLVLMPTGGGKSLCYQVPAILRPGVGLVISPLIALMRDQVEALRQLGVRAAALNSTLSFSEAKEVERAMRRDELDLVYVSPERLLNESFLDHLAACKLALFAIDEAHCVSQWGHDFRPEYRRLAVVHERFSSVPRLALTATADGPTRKDIVERLKLAEGRLFIAGFDRPNINYQVAPKDNPRAQLLRFFQSRHLGSSGIVYCRSRRKVEETAAWLAGEGFAALPYHAGLTKEARQANQDRFVKEDAVIIVATIAFGMGIDKPDVRFVAHMDLPKSLEAYYQETGRAGRDGLPSDAWMVYNTQDMAQMFQLIDASEVSKSRKQVERQKLSALLGYCETARCRRRVLLEYFGESQPESCGNCDTCLEPVQTFDGSQAARKAMSAIYRTGEMFGAAHIIDVLLGGDTEKIRKFGHHRLSTYGIGAEFSKVEWRCIIRQLVAQSLVSVDMEGHGGLRLGSDSRPVLRGERTVLLRKDPVKKQARRKKDGLKPRDTLDTQADEALFQALRARRMELARTQGVPPYVILHDATLAEIAKTRPSHLHQLACVSGIGQAKLARYGEIFLKVVAAQA